MTRAVRSISLAVLASLAILAVAALPAAAYEVKGMGFYARFVGPSAGSGLIVADRTGGNQPRIQVTFVGLLPFVEQDNVYRSIGCAGTPRAANRVFRTMGAANANGELTYNRTPSSSIEFDRVRSVWSSVDGSTSCTPVEQFERVAAGDVNGDDVLGLTKVGAGTQAIALIEKRPNDRARLSIVIFGRDGNDELRFRGSTTACGSSASSSSIVIKEVLVSSFTTGIHDIHINQLVALRSMRVRNVDSGQSWCAPLGIIMANTAGD